MAVKRDGDAIRRRVSKRPQEDEPGFNMFTMGNRKFGAKNEDQEITRRKGFSGAKRRVALAPPFKTKRSQ